MFFFFFLNTPLRGDSKDANKAKLVYDLGVRELSPPPLQDEVFSFKVQFKAQISSTNLQCLSVSLKDN